MNLLFSPASPYVSKVRLAAHFSGIAITEVAVDAPGEEARLLGANPLGKIPCLLLDDGTALFDSRVITRHFDRISGGKLYPVDARSLMLCERGEALADGIADAAVAGIYEQRFRPADIVHQPWLDRQWGKVCRALDHANSTPPALDGSPQMDAIALAAALGYLDLRYANRWQEGRSALAEWQTGFASQNPAYAQLKPLG